MSIIATVEQLKAIYGRPNEASTVERAYRDCHLTFKSIGQKINAHLLHP